jgi:hypothetical protein
MRRLLDVAHAPLWLVVLAAAAVVPFGAAAWQGALDSKRRRVTRELLERARAAAATVTTATPTHDDVRRNDA